MRIGKGYNAGRNDLEGRTDSAPQEPIIAAAHAALSDFYNGKVNVVGVSKVKIIETGKAWAVIGEYNARAIHASTTYASTVPPYNNSAQIVVPVTPDSLQELSESFRVVLTSITSGQEAALRKTVRHNPLGRMA